MFDLQNTTVITGVLSALAFVITIIVELTKELPLIKRIPTKLWTITISIIVCITAVIVYVAITAIKFQWYYIALTFLAAFIVAYIAMYGWKNTKELYDRFKNKSN